MLIGMVLAEDKETIVPIVEGVTARIYNTSTGEISDSPNPALHLTEGRRGATVNWMVKNGVKVLCAPPGTLCELSYSKAQEEKLNYYRLEPGMNFSTFQADLENEEISLSAVLPDEEVEVSNPPNK